MSLANVQLTMREDGIDDSIFESAVFTSDVQRLQFACAAFLNACEDGFEIVDTGDTVRQTPLEGVIQ